MNAIEQSLVLAQAEGNSFASVLLICFLAIFGLFLLIFLGMFASVASLWFRSLMSGAPIGPIQMVAMKLKKVNLILMVILCLSVI